MADQPNKVVYMPGLNKTRVYNANGELISQVDGDQSSPGPGDPDYTWAKDTRGHLKPSAGGSNALIQSGKDLAVDTASAAPMAISGEGMGALALKALGSLFAGGGTDALLNRDKPGGDVAMDAARRTAVNVALPLLIKGFGAAKGMDWMPRTETMAEPTTASNSGTSRINSASTGVSTTGAVPDAPDNTGQAAARAYSQGEIARMQGINVKTPSQGTQITNAIAKHQAVIDALDEANKIPGTQTTSSSNSNSTIANNGTRVTQPGNRVTYNFTGTGYVPMAIRNGVRSLAAPNAMTSLQRALMGLAANGGGDVLSDLMNKK